MNSSNDGYPDMIVIEKPVDTDQNAFRKPKTAYIFQSFHPYPMISSGGTGCHAG